MVEKKLIDVIPDAYEQIEKIYKSEPFELTGFVDIDEMIRNFEGGIVTIAGRPAMGKSSFLYSIIENLIKKNKKILHFSLGASKEQAVQRMLCINAEIDSQRIRSGNMMSSDWEKLADSMTRMSEWELYIDDNAMASTEDIENAIKKHKPDFVCIDNLQLINVKSKKDRNFQIEDIMKALNKIAKENGVIIFLLSQLSRAPELRMDKRPQLSDLRGSSSIEVLSDVVMFIYREDYYSICTEDTELNKGEAEIIVAKNNFGTVGTAYLNFKFNICKFSERIRYGSEF